LETLLAFGLGLLTSYWVLGAFILFAIWVESNDCHGWSATFTILGLVSAYFIFSLSPLLLLAYIPVGILWSVWRWKVYCKDCLKRAKAGNLYTGSWNEVGSKENKEASRRALESATKLSGNVDKIVAWIICFPASMIERLASDLIDFIRIVVTDWCAKLYTGISANTLKDFDKD